MQQEIIQNWLKTFDSLEPEAKECLIEFDQLINNFVSQNSEIPLVGLQKRVKSKQSFSDKLVRKSYITQWEYNSQFEDQNKSFLAEHLQDFIGIRLNTYFQVEEEELFNKLINFLEENEKIIIPDEEKKAKRQQNQHEIFKFSGTYEFSNRKFGFEIQIKSSVHNLWGEVDHFTIYKPHNFDFNISTKKELTESVFQILANSDTQLYNLKKNNTYEIQKLLNQLFFEFTKNDIFQTEIFTHNYYDWFYNIFHQVNINDVLVSFLNEEEYIKKDFNIDILHNNNIEVNEEIHSYLSNVIKKVINEGEADNIAKILSFIFKNINKDDIYQYIADYIYFELSNYFISNSSEQDELDTFFPSDEDEDDFEDSEADFNELLNNLKMPEMTQNNAHSDYKKIIYNKLNEMNLKIGRIQYDA